MFGGARSEVQDSMILHKLPISHSRITHVIKGLGANVAGYVCQVD